MLGQFVFFLSFLDLPVHEILLGMRLLSLIFEKIARSGFRRVSCKRYIDLIP